MGGRYKLTITRRDKNYGSSELMTRRFFLIKFFVL